MDLNLNMFAGSGNQFNLTFKWKELKSMSTNVFGCNSRVGELVIAVCRHVFTLVVLIERGTVYDSSL